MALKIYSPGLDQYGSGGTARVKVLVIGGPGAGKTRWSSFFPKPIFAAAEPGLASVADRGKAVAAVDISNSQDMLDLLKLLEQECKKPQLERRWETVVVDTIDAFQRKVQDEWLRKNPNVERFSGFDAWGYLDAKMQLLLTRLLNLDMNVVVTVHYDEKTVTEGVGDQATQRQVIQLQLQGKSKDQLFNDFDLVGWMGTFWSPEKGQRVQKRGLTFQPSYEKPFLKDRLHVTPSWMPVEFSTDDYDALFAAIAMKLDDLPESEDLGEVPATEQDTAVAEGGLVMGGAMPEVSPKDVPLDQHDRPTLLAMARSFQDPPIDGIKGNTIKSELINKIRARQALKTDGGTSAAQAPPKAAQSDDTAAAPTVATEKPQVTPTIEQIAEQSTDSGARAQTAQPETPAPTPTPEPERVDAPGDTEDTVKTEAGTVDANGEIVQEPTHDEAVETVKEQLGATVLKDAAVVPSTTSPAEEPPTAPAPAPASPPAGGQRGAAPGVSGVCEEDGCDVDLSGEVPDLVKLSYIKFRKKYCNSHFQSRRQAAAS